MHLLNVLMKWEKKKLALEAPKTEKTEESEDAKKEGVKDDDVEVKEEKSEDAKKVKKAEDSKEGEAKAGDVGNKRQQDSWGVITRIQNCDPIAEISARGNEIQCHGPILVTKDHLKPLTSHPYLRLRIVARYRRLTLTKIWSL